MTAIWAPLVVLLALAAVGAARSERGSRAANAAAWVALALGFAFLQWGSAGLASAVAVAAIAGLAIVRNSSGDAVHRQRVATFAAIVPITLAVTAMICVRDAATQWSAHLVLFTAAWAAMVAGLSSCFAAIAAAKRPLSGSVGVAAFGAAVGVYTAGTGRSSLPDAFYGFPLRTGDTPLQWVMSPTPSFDAGITLSVAAPVASVQTVLMALAGLAIVATVLLLAGRHKAAGTALILGLVGSGGMLAALQPVVGGLKMPASEPYADEVKRMLLARGGERVVDAGAFNGTADVTVAMADVAPEIAGLAIFALLCLAGWFALRSQGAAEAATGDDVGAREYRVQGVAFLWVSWFVLLVIHDGFLGSPGLGSPGEWVFTGVILTATGLLVATWEASNNRLMMVLEDLTPGLIAAGILLAAGLAWRFGALPGLSLGIF